ncbi:TPA: DNA polymerase I [Candidatus Uhrbacteria bacterium]|uniref:DNA polymerase I n=3 Tax=Candidatus Uhriibacteriota TaxID=1752732 RepID=A0A0G1Q909_9BACT|nr:MAG: polymerase protein [Candidatus Uhrbacteria bacterium GW2011_GWE2_46_68]HBK33553.1 DNA polymerase I [Candidatus Uhrbacteria bacterium]HCB19492.1 DNA polymerase I [Candidatus Uhrbacteria bacterium]
MEYQKPRLLLLDGNALLHRAWHAIPPLTTKDGLVVNAAYGFSMILERMLKQYAPTHMVVAWDRREKTFRHEEFAAYKAQREKKEQELYDQIPIIQNILKAHGIISVDARGYEADDIIGTYATQASKKEWETFIVTGDLDSLQLVDRHVHVVTFKKGVSETMEYDEAAVKERYGLTPKQLIDYKALRGDPSDNIPGVMGIGEKTAVILLQEYGDLAHILKALASGGLDQKYAKKFEGQEEIALQALRLVTIVKDMDLPLSLTQTTCQDAHEDEIKSLYQSLEFHSLLRHRQEKNEKAVSKEEKEKPRASLVRKADASTLETFCRDRVIGFFVLPKPADLFGSASIAFAFSDGKEFMVFSEPTEEEIKEAQRVLSLASTAIVCDLKKIFHLFGNVISGNFFDLELGYYLLHSGDRVHDVVDILRQTLGDRVSDTPISLASAGEEKKIGFFVSCFIPAFQKIQKEMVECGMTSVFEHIEMPLVPVLYVMEKRGVLVNTKALGEFSKELQEELKGLTEKITKSAGETFNINSPLQLAEVLFDHLHLPIKGIKKTQTGYSTAAAELEKLWETHEIIPLISEYRELAKLQSTYVEALPRLVKPDGRIHTTYQQAVTATGRLSSSDPNLQNIPIRTDLGKKIREAFEAPRGKRILSADYSQVELRLVAVIAKDKAFISAFKEGADIHTRTAAEVWGIEELKVTSSQRRAAKAINFGIIYGMGPRSLARSTGMTMGEAKHFIDRYFEIHHAVKDYLDETKIKARERGYVETLFGRRRYLPEIHSGVQQLVASAERMAINMPVQGTAADLMKKAMLAVDGWLQTSKWPAELILQVHDELVFEVEKDAVSVVASGVKKMMEGVADFDVPLCVEVEAGKNWGEMESVL